MKSCVRTELVSSFVRIVGLASIAGALVLTGGCSTKEAQDVSSAKQAIIGSTLIDSSHPYVVRVRRGVSPCTGTLLPGGFVLTAAHCFQGDETISSPEVLGNYNPRNYVVYVDLDGDLQTYADQFTYTPTHVKIAHNRRGANGETYYLDMALLYFAPSVAKPHDLFKPIALGGTHPLDLPKVVTSFQDNATPSDLDTIVVHVQFDPEAFFSPPASGPAPYRFDFFGFGESSYASPDDFRYRLATRQTPVLYGYSTNVAPAQGSGPMIV